MVPDIKLFSSGAQNMSPGRGYNNGRFKKVSLQKTIRTTPK